MNRSSSMQNGPIDHVTFDLSTPKGHSLHQVSALWDHSFLSYAADKQTDKQTDGLERPTYSDRHSRRGYWVIIIIIILYRPDTGTDL